MGNSNKHRFVNTDALFVAIQLNAGEKIWELEEYPPLPQNIKENMNAANWVVSQFGYNYPNYMMEVGFNLSDRSITKAEWKKRAHEYRYYMYQQNNYDGQGGQGMNL